VADLTGKVAIITGATRGIGRGVTQYFADAGARLAICARSAGQLEAVSRELELPEDRLFAVACDIADRNQMKSFVTGAADRFGKLDMLINNACYIPEPCSFESYDDADFDLSISTGVTAVYHAMRAAFPYMQRSGGRIINFTSIGGLRGMKGFAGYAAAKAGLVGLTRVAANEWAAYGVTVNCIAPMAMSEQWRRHVEAAPQPVNPFHAIGLRSNAEGRPGEALTDIAPVVAYLCSDEARFITGHVLPVDGGLLELE